jgi:DNA-binding LytR/AlgR family response regulator
MKTINCIIVDDEAYANNVLIDYIAKAGYINLTGVFINPIEALAEIKRTEVDLVFLDIQMPELSGIDLLKMLPENTQTIITTAYSDYALDSFDNNACDYLLKPYSFGRFLKATQKALNQKNMKEALKNNPVNNANGETIEEPKPDSFYIKTDRGKFVRVKHGDIFYIEGLKNYCSIYTDGHRHVSLVSMKALSDGLPDNEFVRVHKSYIISLKKVASIEGNMIVFADKKEKIPIGTTYRNDFFDRLNRDLFS